MTDLILNASVRRGAHWIFDAELLNADFTAMDLTGATKIEYRVVRPKGPPVLVVGVDLSSGVSIVSAVDGTIEIIVPDSVTKDVAPGVYQHEIWVKLASDITVTPVAGALTVGVGLEPLFPDL